ncbi:hypothetical protein N9L28_03690 [Luminiphilus sp.]|nr:hypothetical protein [Luminiphilus sp.]
MELFFFWVLLSICVCMFAKSRHRSAIGWFILSLLISPLISLILIAILGEGGTEIQKLDRKINKDKLYEDRKRHLEERASEQKA